MTYHTLPLDMENAPMQLEHWETRDPLSVAIRRESTTCKGCHHIELVRCLGSVHQVCRVSPTRVVERRCRQYFNPAEER